MTRSWHGWSIVATLLVVAGCTGTPATSAASGPPTSAPWPSPADLGTIRGLINSRAGDQLASIGFGNGTVIVGLRAGGEELAREIVDTYGASVEVTVGFFRYPSNGSSGDVCSVPWTLADHSGLRASVEMTSTRIVSGTTFEATVRISDVDTRTITLETSSGIEVHLFLPGGTKPVGGFELAVAGTGLGTHVEPGKSITVPGYGGTASCDLSLGYALKPGRYEARALVDFALGPENGHGPLVFWSDPLAVDVVPPGS